MWQKSVKTNKSKIEDILIRFITKTIGYITIKILFLINNAT